MLNRQTAKHLSLVSWEPLYRVNSSLKAVASVDTALGYRLEAQPSVVHLLVTALMTKTLMFSVSFFCR